MKKGHEKRKGRMALLVGGMVILSIIAGMLFMGHAERKTKESVADDLDALLGEREMTPGEELGTRIGNTLVGDVTYKIYSLEDDRAEVLVKAPDIRSLYKKIIGEQGKIVPESMEEYQALVDRVLVQLERDLVAGNYEYVTNEIAVTLVEGEIEPTYELIDALYGGLLTLQNEMVDQYTGGGKS